MGYYVIQANVVITSTDRQSHVSRQVPTFYLHESVQGIVSEAHAINIAYSILTAGLTNDQMQLRTFHIVAVKIA